MAAVMSCKCTKLFTVDQEEDNQPTKTCILNEPKWTDCNKGETSGGIQDALERKVIIQSSSRYTKNRH